MGELDGELLPSPFTPTGGRPEAPAWYATPTVAYAVELGYEVRPVEAWVRYDNGRYLDGWYNRLRDAYIATMGDLGVPADASPEEFLAAMDGYRQRDRSWRSWCPPLRRRRREGWANCASGLAARAGSLAGPVPADVAPGHPCRDHLPDPDQHAPQAAQARLLHGQYPLAILSDCAVYAVDGESPLDFLPYREGKLLLGGFKLGVNPGLVKWEGTQSVLWGEGVREQFKAPELNLARYIKTAQSPTRTPGSRSR